MRRIVLIGMPGAGKTTVGRRLAQVLGVLLLDTDRLMEARFGRPVRVLLEQEGREAFLRHEAETVLAMDAPEGAVVSTGGSIVYSDAAMAKLRSLGAVVYLKADAAALARRTGDLRRRGVVAAEGTTHADLLAERAPLYEKYADVTVDATRLRPDDLVHRILALLPPDPA
jgi:shikimate kinase